MGRISTDANGEGRENDFLEVILPSGRRGWVLKDDVEDFHSWTVSRSFTAEDILHTAYRLIGIPYMWGGTSIGQVDCSGLTRLVFFMNGILLPRNSSQQAKVGENISLEGRRQAKVGENISLEGKLQAKVGEDVSMEGRRQAKVGEEVSLNALKPADLLFFGKPATEDSPERISHVAIYLGDGLYIHSSQKVRISSLDSGSEDYGGRMPFKARRILGHVDDGTGIISIAKSPHYFLQSE